MITFKHVDVKFETDKGAVHAVKDVSFSIEEGSIFGIIGASGAGKSTLLRTINGLEKANSGEVVVDGQVINHLSSEELRRHREHVGMIFQHFNLISSKTVEQNIAYPLKIAKREKKDIEKRIDELLEMVDLKEKKHSYPAKLSGGQKQRVGIARALANDTRILLCDEPTSALDPETTKNILQLLNNLSKALGITIVIITHELDVVSSICTQVAVMREGEVVEIGNVYDIFTNPQNEYTKKLIASNDDFEIPEEIISSIRKENEEKGHFWKIIRVNYIGDKAMIPLISMAAKKFNAEIGVIHGKIDYIKGMPAGKMYIHVYGDKVDVENAIKYIDEQAHSVEVLYEYKI